jgi:pimeloyl-ACP methyl ester carboxylesterase
VSQLHVQVRIPASGRAAGRIAWRRFTPPKRLEVGEPPLLLIHGFACGAGDWGALPRILAAKARRDVLVFDNRGIGASEAPAGAYSVQELSADAHAVCDDAGAGPVAVMGISLGGLVAQSFALTYPARTRALVLGCTSHGGSDAVPTPPAFLSLCEAWAAEPSPNDAPHVDAFMALQLPEEMRSRGPLFDQFKAAFLRTARSSTGLRGQLAALSGFDSTARLAELRCPTLLVSGDEDAVVPPKNAETLARRIAGARHVSWGGAGHFWWAHRTVEAADLIASFLQIGPGRPY